MVIPPPSPHEFHAGGSQNSSQKRELGSQERLTACLNTFQDENEIQTMTVQWWTGHPDGDCLAVHISLALYILI